MPSNNLPSNYLPTAEDANWFISYWEKHDSYYEHENALTKLFQSLCPRNDCLDDVLIKCSTLNDFYSTNIFNVRTVAHHILNLNIDERLRKGDFSLVSDVAAVNISGKERHFYSFATKYCCYHQPEKYVIYDSYVEKVLLEINKRTEFAKFQSNDLKNYDSFIKVVNDFRERFGLSHYSVRDLDHYLWQLGKWYFPKNSVFCKYYNREPECPFQKADIRSKFWWGEMIFVTQHKDSGKLKPGVQAWLETAGEEVKRFAQSYSIEQLGLISFISQQLKERYPDFDQSQIMYY